MKRLIFVILYLVLTPFFLKSQDIENFEPLMKKGFFFEWNPAFYILNEETDVSEYSYVVGGRRTLLKERVAANYIPCFGLTHKIGAKGYFWGNEQYRWGFQLVWLQGGFLMGGSDGSYYISFGGFGLTRIQKFTKHLGLENSFSIAPNLMIGDKGLYFGPFIDTDVKFRINYLAVGFRLSYGIGFSQNSYYEKQKMHIIELAFTVGAKF